MRFIPLLILFLLLGCQESIPSQSGEVEILFCQVDDCEAMLLNAINTSSDVSCAFYDLELESLESLLAKKDAEVLIFEENYQGFGKSVKAPHGGLMHNKFCILDNSIITGSLNPTVNGITRNENNLLFIEGEVLLQNYRDEFAELQGERERSVHHRIITHSINNRTFLIENLFCPEDDCEVRLLELINNAEESIHFMLFSFTSDAIGDALLQQEKNGLHVSGIFDAQQISKYSEFKKLQDAGVDVRKEVAKGKLHHKVFIIDKNIVVTGSYNPTKNGNERNDENIIIIHDVVIATQFLNEFNRVAENIP